MSRSIEGCLTVNESKSRKVRREQSFFPSFRKKSNLFVGEAVFSRKLFAILLSQAEGEIQNIIELFLSHGV